MLKPTKVVEVPPRQVCPKHFDQNLEPFSEGLARRLIIDLVLMKNGIKKTITEFVGPRGYCGECKKSYEPPFLAKFGKSQLYGHGFKAWCIYQRIALRMPYNKIIELASSQFREDKFEGSVTTFMRKFALYYIETEGLIKQRLLQSKFIHVDETLVNIHGTKQYVWVFTNGTQVFFKLTDTREANLVHGLMASYEGVLITDFYPGYDSVDCSQQKCWVHLIRDLNNDLWKHPFDIEYEQFVLAVRDLITPIMKAVQQYGLRRRNLNKFQHIVDKFYRQTVTNRRFKSEIALKYQERFRRYQNSLFTFLDHNSVPWHNNTAERALRHLVVQEKISGYFHGTLMPHYLRLLGIHQTCRFQDKSFFDFLFSGEKDIDQFRRYKR